MPAGRHKLLPAKTGNKGPHWTPLDRAFVAEYLVDLNATQAYGRAGGAKKHADVCGPRMLRKPHVRAAIDAALAEREREIRDAAVKVAEVTLARALMDPGQAFDEQGEPLTLRQMPIEMRRAVSSVRIEYEERQVVDGAGQPVRSDTGKPVTLRLPKVAEIRWHDSKPDRELFLKYAGKLKEKVELELGDTLAELVPKRNVEES